MRTVRAVRAMLKAVASPGPILLDLRVKVKWTVMYDIGEGGGAFMDSNREDGGE